MSDRDDEAPKSPVTEFFCPYCGKRQWLRYPNPLGNPCNQCHEIMDPPEEKNHGHRRKD